MLRPAKRCNEWFGGTSTNEPNLRQWPCDSPVCQGLTYRGSRVLKKGRLPKACCLARCAASEFMHVFNHDSATQSSTIPFTHSIHLRTLSLCYSKHSIHLVCTVHWVRNECFFCVEAAVLHFSLAFIDFFNGVHPFRRFSSISKVFIAFEGFPLLSKVFNDFEGFHRFRRLSSIAKVWLISKVFIDFFDCFHRFVHRLHCCFHCVQGFSMDFIDFSIIFNNFSMDFILFPCFSLICWWISSISCACQRPSYRPLISYSHCSFPKLGTQSPCRHGIPFVSFCINSSFM